MKTFSLISIAALLFWSCNSKPVERAFDRQIQLENAPLGLALAGEDIWISDSDENVVFRMNEKGEKLHELTDFERPMHIAVENDEIYTPEYGRDSVSILSASDDSRRYLAITDSLDAPAGIAKSGDKIAIADFYNNRILAYDGSKWFSFGEKGEGAGGLNYPTDIALVNDKIVVADAYNNRIQVFDWTGKSTQLIGSDQGMNATTGVYATENEIFATDFENSRILIFNWEGEILQVLNENLDKPTDLVVRKDELWVANYAGKSISIYKAK